MVEQIESTADASSWAVLVPIKKLHLAKTRLDPPRGVRRADLALAMALDVIAASLECPLVARVIAITNDPRARGAVESLAASWVEDDPDSGLNPALTHAAEHARAEGFERIVAISSDLPSLNSPGLGDFLAAIEPHTRAMVRDAHDTGTALLAASSSDLLPAFGPGSALAHLRSGASDETSRVGHPGLRRDVDTIDDLLDARRIGVGKHTSALLSAVTESAGGRR